MFNNINFSRLKVAMSGFLASTFLLAGSVAFAQAEITVGTGSGPAGGSAVTSIDWVEGNNVSELQIEILYDDAVLTPQADGDTPPNVNGCLDGLSSPHADSAFTACVIASPGRVVLTIHSNFTLDTFATTNVGTITWDIAGGATVPSTEVLTANETDVTLADNSNPDPATTFTANDGAVNIVDVSAILNVQPANINFPATENGTSSAAQAFTISNDGSDGIDLQVSNVALATGTHFSISANSCAGTSFTLSDGQSCTFNAVFSPTAIGNFNDTVTVTSDAGQVNNDQVALSGEGTAGPAATLDVAPASHDYGDVLTGDSATFTFTVSNTGETGSSLDIDAIGLGGGTDFSISGGTCSVGDTLADGDSCTVAVDFAPATDGAQSDTLTVDGTDTVNSTSVSDSAALDGNGVTEARFSSDPAPGAVNMGLAPPGGSLNQTVVVTNEGNANLTVNNCTLNDPDGLFSITPDPIDFNIAPDGSDSFAVSCDVPEPGSFSASLSCDTNDPNNATVSYTFTCNGQILEIPTMQPWGLVLLTMLMLMIGGLSIRYFRV